MGVRCRVGRGKCVASGEEAVFIELAIKGWTWGPDRENGEGINL